MAKEDVRRARAMDGDDAVRARLADGDFDAVDGVELSAEEPLGNENYVDDSASFGRRPGSGPETKPSTTRPSPRSPRQRWELRSTGDEVYPSPGRERGALSLATMNGALEHRHGPWTHEHHHHGPHRHARLPFRSVEATDHDHAGDQRNRDEDARDHDDSGDPHEHTHGRVDRSILRSRAGVRAVAWSLGILGATALLQGGVFLLSGSVALLADLIHNGGDALTAIRLQSRSWREAYAANDGLDIRSSPRSSCPRSWPRSSPSTGSSTRRTSTTSALLPSPA